MTTAMGVSVFLVLLIANIGHCYQNVSGGAHVTISKDGLNSLLGIGIRILEEKLSHKSFDKTYYGSIGPVHYYIDDIHVHTVKFEKYDFRPIDYYDAAMVTVELSLDAELQIAALYRNQWFKLSDQTKLHVDVKEIKISFAFRIDMSRGNIHVNTIDCRSRIKNIDFRFKHGYSWLYRILTSIFKDQITNKLGDLICDARKHIDVKSIINSINTKIDLSRHVSLDLSIQDIAYNHQRLDVKLKGEGKTRSAPDATKYIRPPAYRTNNLYRKTASIYISSYLLNTAASSYYYSGDLSRLVPLSTDMVSVNYTNTRDFYHVFPKLYEKHPNQPIRYGGFFFNRAPIFDIEYGYTNVNVTLLYTMIINSNGNYDYLQMHIVCMFKLYSYIGYESQNIFLYLRDARYNATLTGHMIDGGSMDFNNYAMDRIYHHRIIPSLRDYLTQNPIKIPSFFGFKVHRPRLRAIPDAIVLDTDFVPTLNHTSPYRT